MVKMPNKSEKPVDKTIESGIIRANETEMLLINTCDIIRSGMKTTAALLHSLAERKYYGNKEEKDET